MSYPRILVKSNSNELWTSLKSSPELCSNKVLMPGKWICFISLLWTFYIYLCILQFLYSGSSNSKYNEFLVLCSYIISFTDSICYLFSVLSISLFPFIKIGLKCISLTSQAPFWEMWRNLGVATILFFHQELQILWQQLTSRTWFTVEILSIEL